MYSTGDVRTTGGGSSLTEDSFRWFPYLSSSDDESAYFDPETDIRLSESIFSTHPDDEWTFPLRLCRPARESLNITNAGGCSDVSEAASIQYFYDLGYTDFVFENYVTYKHNWKMVDFVANAPQKWETLVPELVKTDRERVGISVTRAADYGKGFDAIGLLYKKLKGLFGARNNVSAECRFYRSILHIWCASNEVSSQLNAAYQILIEDPMIFNNPDLKGSFKVITTVCSDRRIYKNYKTGLE